MIKKYINLLKFKEIRDRLKSDQKGLTLVEVIIAFFIITLVAVVLIQGVAVSTKTLKVNKAKTEAVAIINEEIEKIRFRDYSDVGIVGATGGDPEGYLDSVSTVGDFTVNRDITWVDGEYSYKQIEITVASDMMHEDITMVTQVSPIFGEGGPPNPIYPPPANLTITGFRAIWWFVELNWETPETDTVIDHYRVWRDDSPVDTTYITRDFDTVFGGFWWRIDYDYYVTVVYQDGHESEPSNTVDTDDL